MHKAAEDEAREAIRLACEGTAVSITPRKESLRRLELRGRAAGARLAAALGRAAPGGRLDAAGCLESAGEAGEMVFLEAPDPRLSDPGEARLLQKAGSQVGGCGRMSSPHRPRALRQHWTQLAKTCAARFCLRSRACQPSRSLWGTAAPPPAHWPWCARTGLPLPPLAGHSFYPVGG